MQQYQSLITSLNWHNPSWDLFILCAWILVSLIYAFTAGRGRIINILMSIYVAQLLVIKAPFISQAASKSLPANLVAMQQLLLFVVLFLLLFFLLGRYAFRTSVDGRRLGSMVYTTIFAFLQIGLLINVLLTNVPESFQKNFGPLVQILFVRNPASFVWLLLPLGFLVLLGRHVSDVHEI